MSPEPDVKVEFKRTKTGFVVCFYRPGWDEGRGMEGGQKRWPEKVARKGGQKITAKQQVVLDLLRKDPFISRDKLAAKLKINVSAVRKHLDALRRKNFIRRAGPDKGGHWEVIS